MPEELEAEATDGRTVTYASGSFLS